MADYNYSLSNPALSAMRGRQVAFCRMCGEKTLLYVAGVPLCIQCDKRMSEEQLHLLTQPERDYGFSGSAN